MRQKGIRSDKKNRLQPRAGIKDYSKKAKKRAEARLNNTLASSVLP